MGKEERFLQIMQDLRAQMVSCGKMLTEKEIAEAFAEFSFDSEKIKEIVDFLATDFAALTAKKSEDETLLEAVEESYETKEPQGEEESEERPNVLKLYLEELSEIEETGDEEGRELLSKYMGGQKELLEAVTMHYLPKVVEIAKIYEGQGVLSEDLIGEGNMALTIGLTMCECSEDVTEAEATIIRMIMDAMEGLIGEEASDTEAVEKAGRIIEEVGEKAEELYKAYGRDVTKEELVSEYEIDPALIEEAIRLSEGNIEHLAKNSDNK